MPDGDKYRHLLEENEERYRTLLELFREAIAIQQEGKFVYVNRAGLELLGASEPGEIIGKKVPDFLEQRLETGGPRTGSRERGRPEETTYKVHTLKGQSREAEVASNAIIYQGKPASQMVITDTTARKMAEKALRFQADVLSQVRDAVVVVDKEQKIIYWNKGAERLYEYTAAETLGRKLEEINPYCWKDPRQKSAASSASNTEGCWRCGATHFTKKRKKIQVELSVSPLRDDSGASVGTLAVTHDITDRFLLEKELRESEKEFRSMFDLAAVGKAQADPASGRLIRVNKKLCDITGFSPDELLGIPFAQLMHPDDRPLDAEVRERAEIYGVGDAVSSTTSSRMSEKRFIRKDGRIIWVKVTGVVVFDGEGRIIRTIADVEDITESRQAEQALRESEERYRSLVDSSPEAIFVEREGICIYVNPAGLELVGAENFGEVKDKEIGLFIHPAFRKAAVEWLLQVAEKDRLAPSLEFKMQRLSSEDVNAEAVGTLITFNGKPATQLIIKDINERKNTELRLRLQATVLSQVNDAVVAIGKNGQIIFWNKGAERLYKLRAEEAIGLRREDVYRYRWITPAEERAAKQLMATTGFLRGENIHILKSGEEIYVESSVSVLTDWSNAPVGWLAVMRDINERKIFERKLRESEERYRSLVESSPDAILVHQDGKLVYVNPSTLKLMRAQEMNEIIGKDLFAFVHPDHRTRAEERLRQVERDGAPLPTKESKIVRVDGSIVYIEVVAAGIMYSGRPAIQIIAKDITERKKFEEALRNSEQLYRLMFESNPHPMWIYDTDSLRFLFVNDAVIARYGYSKAEFLSMTARDIRLAEDVSVLLDNASKIAAGLHDEGNWRHRKKDGTVIDVEIISHSLKIEGKDARVVLAHDVTDRKKAEAALRESQQAYRTLAENLPGIVYRVFSRENNRVQFFNKTATALTGYRDEELSRGRACCLESLILPEDRSMAIGEVQRALEEKRPFIVEYRLTHRTGEIRFMLEQGSPIYGADGTLLYIDGVISDVSERKEAERALRESEERQRAVFDHSPMAIIAKDLQGRHLVFNRQAEKWMNISREDALGRTVYDFLPRNEADQCTIGDQKVIDGGVPVQTEEIMQLADGLHTHLTVKFPLFNAAGSIYAICCIMSDITEMKRAEQAIKEARDIALLERNRLETILNTIPSALFVEAKDGGVILQNKQLQEMAGRKIDHGSSAQERIEKFRICKPDGSQFSPEELPSMRALRSGKIIRDVELVLERRDGQHIIVSANAAPLRDTDGNIIASVTAFNDITERKRAEQAIKEARDAALRDRSKLEIILNTIPSGVIVAEGPDAKITHQNEQAFQIIGRSVDSGMAAERIAKYEMTKSDGTLFTPEELPYLRPILHGEHVRDVEMTLHRPDGRKVTILANAAPVRDSQGNIIASVSAFSEITERKEAEDALKKARTELELRVRERTGELAATVAALQSEIAERKRTAAERDKLVAAVESTAEAVVVTDNRGMIQYVNPSFEQITGYQRHEALGRDIHFLDSGQHDADFFPAMRETIRQNGVWKGRLINKKKDGTIYYEDCTYSPVKDRSGNIVNYVSIKHDVTERLKLESIAETVDAMNNIGYVFSGIRHEIGNPVSSLLIVLSLLRKKYDSSPKEAIREYVEQAISQVERIEYLLKSLKNFNMYENLQIRTMETASFLEKFIPLVSADLAKKGIDFQVEAAPEVRMSVDPRALQQALVNVVVNASDAVAQRPQPKISLTASKAGSMVRFRITDNGAGIPEDKKKDLFKPFYTTKSSGTGLGLVITRKLISRMKGFIEIESRKDQGTAVDIYVPEGTVERTV